MSDEKIKDTFVGRGWSFPLRLNSQGQVGLARGGNDIDQSIRIILETFPGERKMRPLFGCRAKELLFMPINTGTEVLMSEYVNDALLMWEPRIDILDIVATTSPDTPGAWYIEIKYQIKATHDERSIVHPFYIEDEEPLI